MLPFFLAQGAVAKRLCTGLQIRVGRFDSGSRLQSYQGLTNDRKSFFTSSVNQVSTEIQGRWLIEFSGTRLNDDDGGRAFFYA